MEQNYWTAKAKRDLGQDLHTCSLTEDEGVGDLNSSTQGWKSKAETAVQKTRSCKRKDWKLTQSIALGCHPYRRQLWGRRAELCWRENSKKPHKWAKKDNNAATAQTIGEMVEAEKYLQSSLEVKGVRDEWRGQEIANPMDDIFFCRRMGAEARTAVSCIAVGISLHICHTIGRYDLLPVKFPTLQDSVFTWKKMSQNCPEEPQMHWWKDTRKRNLCCLARGPRYDGKDCNRQAKCTKIWTELPERLQQASLTQAEPNSNTRELAGSPHADSQNRTHCTPPRAPQGSAVTRPPAQAVLSRPQLQPSGQDPQPQPSSAPTPASSHTAQPDFKKNFIEAPIYIIFGL